MHQSVPARFHTESRLRGKVHYWASRSVVLAADPRVADEAVQ